MKTKAFGIAALLLAAVVVSPLTGAPRAPTLYNTYDGLPPGGRSTAMGMAYCAVGEDPSTAYFNPAGLASLEHNTFAITYEATRQSTLTTEEIFSGEMLRNNRIIFLSLSAPQGSFSWRPLSNASFRTGTAGGADFENDEIKVGAYTFSAAHKASDRLTTGINLSYLSGQIAQSGMQNGVPFTNLSDGYGFAMDIGFIYRLAPELQWGVNFQNLAASMCWEDFETDLLPFALRTGLAFKITNFMTFSTDWERRYYRMIDPTSMTHFGLEQKIGRLLAVRGGMFGTDLNDKETAHITLGVGYALNALDLSLTGEKYRLTGQDVYRYLLGLNLPL